MGDVNLNAGEKRTIGLWGKHVPSSIPVLSINLPTAKASNLCCSSGALRFTPGLTSYLSASQNLFVTVFNLIPLAIKVIACVSRAASIVLLGRRSWHLPSQGHSLRVSERFWPALLSPWLALLCPRAGTSRLHRSHLAAGMVLPEG